MPSSDPNRKSLSDYQQRLRQDDLKINRDEQGNLLPVNSETDSGRKVRVLPLTLGDIKEMRAKRTSFNLPIRLIKDHYIEPDFSGSSIDEMKSMLSQEAVGDLNSALMEASGLTSVSEDEQGQEDIDQSVEEEMQEGIQELEGQPRFEYQMHTLGYTAVSNPTYYALTLQEIRRLMEGFQMSESEKYGGGSSGNGRARSRGPDGDEGREPSAAELAQLRKFDKKTKQEGG